MFLCICDVKKCLYILSGVAVLQLHVQSVTITTKVVSSNLVHDKLCTRYNIINNISVILRWSVLLVEETELPGENH